MLLGAVSLDVEEAPIKREGCMQYIIYGLIDPRNNQLRYIGQSSTGLDRPKRHNSSYYLRPHKGLRTHKQRWILQLLSLNLKPEIIILEQLDKKEQLNESEIFYIAYFKSLGCRLTNTTLGGQNSNPPPKRVGWNHTEESKQIMRQKALGKIISQEQRDKISKKLTGRKNKSHSEETKRKIALTRIGRKTSDETKQKQSIARKMFLSCNKI